MLKMIKTVLSKLIKEEKGQILTMVLALLVLGSLLIAPALVNASATLIAGRMYNERSSQLYAADAGVEDALYKLYKQWDNPNIPKNNGTWIPAQTWSYTLSPLNGKTTTVTIDGITGNATDKSYKITAIATGTGSTKIEAYTELGSLFINNAAVCGGTITTHGTVTIQYPDGSDAPVIDHYTGTFPTPADLLALYRPQTPYPTTIGNTITITGDTAIPASYCNTALTIKCTANGSPTATLNGPVPNGTIYVNGDLTIGQTQKDFVLDLNGNTIYCTGSASIGGKTTIKGTGVIISVGSMTFMPNIAAGSEDNFILVMSVTSTTTFQPGGNFYGTVSGDVDITLQPGCKIILPPPPEDGLNYPALGGASSTVWLLHNWTSIRQ